MSFCKGTKKKIQIVKFYKMKKLKKGDAVAFVKNSITIFTNLISFNHD